MVDEKYCDEQMKKDLHPHKEAFLAMIMYGQRYAQQRRGCIGFYDNCLSDREKEHIKELVDRIEELSRMVNWNRKVKKMEYDIEATVNTTVEADDKEKAEAEFHSMMPMNSAVDILSVKKTKQP